MANRSYLYSTDALPGSPEWSEKKKLRGIGEFRYDIPLAFKILLTGNPVACRSSIWETPDTIAIVGDYARGLENLKRYLERIADPAARPLIEETVAFLGSPKQEAKYFVLECGEIFDLTEGPLAGKNAVLLNEIRSLGEDIGKIEVPLPVDARQGFLSKLFKLKAPDPRLPYYDIGLGAWSGILYFDFSENLA